MIKLFKALNQCCALFEFKLNDGINYYNGLSAVNKDEVGICIGKNDLIDDEYLVIKDVMASPDTTLWIRNGYHVRRTYVNHELIFIAVKNK